MKILFIDDEKRRMEPVVEELELLQKHKVIFEYEVDSAVKLIEDTTKEFDVFIIDVSMPPGREFRGEDTYGGARTGVHLYDLIRKTRPNAKVVILTNVADRGLAERFGKEDPSLCRFIRKASILPFELVEEIEKFKNSTSN